MPATSSVRCVEIILNELLEAKTYPEGVPRRLRETNGACLEIPWQAADSVLPRYLILDPLLIAVLLYASVNDGVVELEQLRNVLDGLLSPACQMVGTT